MASIFQDKTQAEPSGLTGFSGNQLVRLSEKRSEHSVPDALADNRARLLLLGHGRALLRSNGNKANPWFSVPDLKMFGMVADEAILLGFDHDGGPVLAVPSDPALAEQLEGIKAIDYRSIYVQGLIDEAALGALAQGAALVSWHRTHPFCACCGQKTVMADGGSKRICPSCKAQHFPRTDPVVIMLVATADNQSCLLGRGPHFPPHMFSCLAGFVEPGETLENAVRREVGEETGIEIGAVRYHASQPWPFPHTLMIGCYCEALSEQIRIDDELEDARWFSRSEVADILNGNGGNGVTMPPPGAIASLLIRDWAG